MISFRGMRTSDADQGLIQSPLFENSIPRNLTFWYYKRGVASAVSYLGLRMTNEQGEQGVNIWRYGGQMAAEWSQTSVPIQKQQGLISV